MNVKGLEEIVRIKVRELRRFSILGLVIESSVFTMRKGEGVESGKNKNVWKYEGKIKNGLPNGQGIINTPDGKKYLGELKEWKHHGQGTFTTTDGERCSWEWNNGKRTIQGIETYSGGGKDEGEWKDGKPWNINRYNKNKNIIGKSLMDKTITNQKYYQVKNSQLRPYPPNISSNINRLFL